MPIKEKNKTPNLNEVVIARGTDIFSSYTNNWSTQVNPNDFFEKETKRTLVTQKRAMQMSDLHLFSLLHTRALSVTSLDREIIGEGVETEFVRETFGNIPNFNWIIYQMLSAVSLGFSITEIRWKLDEQKKKIIIQNLLSRCQDKFIYDNEWVLKVMTEGNPDGESLPELTFLEFTFMGEHGNKYGDAILHYVFWYWYIKKHSVKFWAIFTERYAMPNVVAKYPSGRASPDTKTSIESFMKNIERETGIMIPDDYILEFLESAKGGTVNSYDTFVTYLDNCMSKAILGHDMPKGHAPLGSGPIENIRRDIKESVINADCDFLESVINDQLIKWLVDYNFSNVKKYPKWRIVRTKKVDKVQMATVIKTLIESGHNEIPISWVNQIIGIPELKEGEKAKVLIPAVAKQPEGFGEFGRMAELILYKKDKDSIT